MIIIQIPLVLKYMFEIFLFQGYWRRTLKYLERIALSDLTHMTSMVDIIAIKIKIARIDRG